MYEPTTPRLIIVKSRLSRRSWAARVESAEIKAAELRRIESRVERGESLNEAIRRETHRSRRSWVIRKWRLWKKKGLEALIDGRLPREPKLSRVCSEIIETARETDPLVPVAKAVEILKARGVEVLPSTRTIRRCFSRVDERRRYAQRKEDAAEKVIELPFAGGELLLAAELQCNAIGALTDTVEAVSAQARRASRGKQPARDVALRNRRGHFTVRYNRQRRRKRGQRVAGYLAPAAHKAIGRVPSWPRFVHERRRTVEAKLRTLTFAPLVSSTKGWDALRAPEAAGLEPLTDFAYMPSTLAKFTSALAISDVGPRFLEAVGRNWHRVAEHHWGEPGAMAALYVDNHAKEVWSSLFTQCGKVSHLSRVMPCITTTYVHTGAGAPLVASVQSGSAPLAPRLVDLVKQAEAKLGCEVRRAVVIDAEGSTFDILKAFADEERVIVTPLRPSRAPHLELRYARGSRYRPYRDNDELRVARAVLTHKSTGRSIEIGALLVRRPHRPSETILLTTGLTLGMEGSELADLYFARWPIQENAFKDGAAVGLDEHRGNCGEMVVNVAVATELERLARRTTAAQDERQELAAQRSELNESLLTAERDHRRASKTLATRRNRLDALIEEGRRDGKQLGRAAVEHQEALKRVEAAHENLDGSKQAVRTNTKRLAELDAILAKAVERSAKIESQATIRKLDVALDSIFTATKLTLALLISFAVRQYLTATPMTPHTFASRVFTVRGRKEIRPDEELIVFYENRRDPEINAALADACLSLNICGLKRNGRYLRYVVEPPA